MLMMMIYTGSKLSFGSFSTEHVFLKCIVKSGLDIDATRVERVKKYNTFNSTYFFVCDFKSETRRGNTV